MVLSHFQIYIEFFRVWSGRNLLQGGEGKGREGRGGEGRGWEGVGGGGGEGGEGR